MTSWLAPTWKLALKPRRRRRRYLAGRRATRSRDRSVTAGHRGHRRGRARHARRRDRFSRRGAREGRCDLSREMSEKTINSDRAHHSSFGCGIEMFSSAQTRCGLTDWLTTIFPLSQWKRGSAHLARPESTEIARCGARAVAHTVPLCFLERKHRLTFARCNNMKLYLQSHSTLKPNASPSPTPLSPYRFGGSAQCLPRVHGGTFMNSSKSYTCTSQQLHPFFRS